MVIHDDHLCLRRPPPCLEEETPLEMRARRTRAEIGLGGDLSLDAFEVFDPATGRWSSLPPLPHGVGAPALSAADGRLVLTGGGDDTNWREGGGWTTGSVWSYEPGSSRWGRLADLRTARHGHASAAIDDRVYVFRGAPCAGYGLTAETESLGPQ